MSEQNKQSWGLADELYAWIGFNRDGLPEDEVKRIQQLVKRVRAMEGKKPWGLADLRNEVDCRIQHGAESNGHLEYVLGRLDELLRREPK